MKSHILQTAIVIGCLCMALSCNGIADFVKGGEAIVFSGGVDGARTATKVFYKGGEYAEGESEPIYWEEGDVMTIYCKQVELYETGTATTADYKVNKVDESNKSIAEIVLNSDTTPIGLRWSDDENVSHYFYAVCPAVSSNGICTSIEEKEIKGNLAVSQNTRPNALSGTAGSNYTLAPDLKWQLLYGYNDTGLKRSNFPSGKSVFLRFNPLVTTIRFTITNSVDKDLVIKELDLLSENTQIAGKFKMADMTDTATDGYPAVATDEDTPGNFKKVTLDLSTSEVTVKKGKSFTFTFFLAPVSDVSDLKLRIVRGGSDNGATLTTRLGYTDGTGLLFPRCEKSFVKGIMVPEGVQWTIDYEPVLTEWIEGEGGDIPLN